MPKGRVYSRESETGKREKARDFSEKINLNARDFGREIQKQSWLLTKASCVY